jgi:hypothetical protein
VPIANFSESQVIRRFRPKAFLANAFLRNPVKRGFSGAPDQWKWSSFGAYAFAETGLVVVNDWSTMKLKLRAA